MDRGEVRFGAEVEVELMVIWRLTRVMISMNRQKAKKIPKIISALCFGSFLELL